LFCCFQVLCLVLAKGVKISLLKIKPGGGGAENRGDAPVHSPAQSNPALLPSSASSNPASAPTPPSSGADVENRGGTTAPSGVGAENRGGTPAPLPLPAPAPGPAPAPVPAPAPPDTTPSHARRIGKVLISDTDLSPIEALIMNKVVPDLYELLGICDVIYDGIQSSVGDVSFRYGHAGSLRGFIEILKAENTLEAFARCTHIHRFRIRTFFCNDCPIRKKNLDNLKTVLDDIIAWYKGPPSAEVENWFKNVDRSDSKSKLDACIDKLILHQTDWENILKN
jgi:hypothetical protein